jgi:hypothetical protein
MVKVFGRRKQRHQAFEAFVCAEVSDWLTQVMAATEDGAVVLCPPADTAASPVA